MKAQILQANPYWLLPPNLSTYLPDETIEVQLFALLLKLNPYSWSISSNNIVGSVIDFHLKDGQTQSYIPINIPEGQLGFSIKFPPLNSSLFVSHDLTNKTDITNVTS